MNTFHIRSSLKNSTLFVSTSGSQGGRYRLPGFNWTIQGIDKYLRGQMGVTE